MGRAGKLSPLTAGLAGPRLTGLEEGGVGRAEPGAEFGAEEEDGCLSQGVVLLREEAWLGRPGKGSDEGFEDEDAPGVEVDAEPQERFFETDERED